MANSITTHKRDIAAFFRDKNGKVVLFQWPNWPLYGWLILKALSIFVTAEPQSKILTYSATLILIYWASLEISHGSSAFRRLLGGLVLIAIIVGLLHL